MFRPSLVIIRCFKTVLWRLLCLRFSSTVGCVAPSHIRADCSLLPRFLFWPRTQSWFSSCGVFPPAALCVQTTNTFVFFVLLGVSSCYVVCSDHEHICVFRLAGCFLLLRCVFRPRKTRICDGTKHRTSEAQNASTTVSINSFKTLDDNRWRSKHVVYNVILNRFKRLFVCM
jgi:hypothetical protein